LECNGLVVLRQEGGYDMYVDLGAGWDIQRGTLLH
jgi:hypothetical protein